jgi:hypothetical protein
MNIDMARLGTVVLRSLRAFEFIGVASLLMLVVVVLMHRRFRRATSDGRYACRVAAAIAVTFGVFAVIGGVGHSAAVASLALKDTEEYGALVILRFTTGVMLLYCGAMNIALYRVIRAGRRWAIGVGVAANLLFWLHLLLVLPLPGTGGTVPFPLGAWSVYLIWLCAAAVASRRETVVALPSVRIGKLPNLD